VRTTTRRQARAIVGVCLAALSACNTPSEQTLTLATTTSVQNSGLLDALAPAFKEDAGIQIRAHLAGSGRALQMLARGDADVAISHAPEAEAAALRRHADWLYRKLMFNDFVVVGPRDDPAQVRDAADAVEAFRIIAAAAVRFVSRGDESGTHERERALWTQAGAQPAGERLITTGAGMAVTLRAASTQQAYTLSDRATFLQVRGVLGLKIVHEGDHRLLNTYAVIVPTGPKRSDAIRFADWLATGRGRTVISQYRIKDALPAFHIWPLGCPATVPSATPC
jgi:tungstate transport system substrate-binding protein